MRIKSEVNLSPVKTPVSGGSPKRAAHTIIHYLQAKIEE